MIDMTEWANGSHNSFGDAIYMATLTTVLVFAVLGVVWRAGRRLALRATHRIPRDAQPLLEDTKFVICLALVCGFGLLLTLNPGLLVLPKDTTFTEQVARQAGLEALSCPTVYDSKYMPGQGRYECEYVDAKGKAHDLSLLITSGDKVWLYDHNGKPMKVETIHAGLECGWHFLKNPNLDMVSIGVTTIDIHSPNEKLLLETVKPQVDLIIETIHKIAKQ